MDSYGLDWERPESFGKLHGFYGNFGVMVRAYTYMRMLGCRGIRETAEAAVLNNAYLTALLKDDFDLPYGRGMHESVFSGTSLKKRTDIKTMDVAKRLLDYGFHAPTVYFPLNVPEALMTEPTETETKDELERYAAAMKAIAGEAETDPEMVATAPHTTPVRRLDEGRAARQLDLKWSFRNGRGSLNGASLRCLVHGPARGAWNMAVDEALMDSAHGGAVTLRLYGWEPGCLSFGRNQTAHGRYDGDVCGATGDRRGTAPDRRPVRVPLPRAYLQRYGSGQRMGWTAGRLPQDQQGPGRRPPGTGGAGCSRGCQKEWTHPQAHGPRLFPRPSPRRGRGRRAEADR